MKALHFWGSNPPHPKKKKKETIHLKSSVAMSLSSNHDPVVQVNPQTQTEQFSFCITAQKGACIHSWMKDLLTKLIGLANIAAQPRRTEHC